MPHPRQRSERQRSEGGRPEGRPGGGLFERERAALVAAGRRLARQNLVIGTAGNLSVRVGDRVLVTPTGGDLGELTEDMITVVAAADGAVLDGTLEPTSELPLHLAVYRARAATAASGCPAASIGPAGPAEAAGVAGPAEAGGVAGVAAGDDTGTDAVAHAHSPASIAVGATHDELPAVHYNTVLLGGVVRVAEYATFGSAALAANVAAALDGRHAALMRNHGSVACGDTIEQACARLELLEWLAEVYCRAAALGSPRILGADELAAVRAELTSRGYGAPRPLR